MEPENHRIPRQQKNRTNAKKHSAHFPSADEGTRIMLAFFYMGWLTHSSSLKIAKGSQNDQKQKKERKARLYVRFI